MAQSLRNIAIIAHVDHGKTTLVDAMLGQTGVFRANAETTDRVMDSNDLEKERGITILAKHCSIEYKDTVINIIDTPGHADFGGEVERTLKMADGVLLLVDAAEGPLPQTRFVLTKSIELGLPIIVVINKIDRQDARADDVLTETFDLFCELDAPEEQLEFPVVYAVGRDGIASKTLEEKGTDLIPLFDMILESIPAPKDTTAEPLQFLVHNTEHDEYVGRLAVGRVWRGRISVGDTIAWMGENTTKNVRLSAVYRYVGTDRVKVESADAGDIVAVSGIEDVQIGDTLADKENPQALERIEVEEPTIKVRFIVNNSPMAGLSGKWVTSRHIKSRLEKESLKNLALRVEATAEPDTFVVFGRGELMLAILAETMRREGFEFSLGMPEVVIKEVDGKKQEPLEIVIVDVPDDYVGAVTTLLGERRGQMINMNNLGSGRSRVEYRIPSRGLIGFRSEFMTETRGLGLLNTLFDGWTDYNGPMLRRKNGAMVSDRKGQTRPYALFHLQPRGNMFLGGNANVYEGMIIGEHNRANDIDVNPTKEKKLTNMRASGKDEAVTLTTPRSMTIDEAMEWIDQDELVEVTPDAIRLRKRHLSSTRRPRRDGT